MENVQHTLTIENRKRLSASGIEGVRDFSPASFTLIYGEGRIIVSGTDMKITAFSKQTGAFAAVGNFTAVKYAAKGESFAKKLFK